MYRLLFVSACLILLSAFTVMAQDGEREKSSSPSDAKELSGMSIVGNDEAPKSLYIVPWKSSELGDKLSLNRLPDLSTAPIDREVFLRQLAYFKVITEAGSHTP